MKKLVVAILILLGAAMTSWFVLYGNERGAELDTVEPGIPEDGEAPAHSKKLPRFGTERVETEARRTVVPRTPREEPVTSDPVDFEIHVKLLADRKPVAGAKVAICDFKTLLASYARIPGPKTLRVKDAAREEISHIALSDTQGIVKARLPIQRTTLIIVTHESLYGRAVISRIPSGPIEILLEEDRTLRVSVLTEGTRKPVPDVPVGFYVKGSGGRRLTNERGLVEFPHAQASLRNKEDGLLRLAIPLHKRVRKIIKLDRFPNEPVVLLLPPTGHITIRVRDEGDKDVDCSKLRFRLDAFMDREREQKTDARPRLAKQTRKGHMSSGRMGLGLFLKLAVSPSESGSVRRTLQFELYGPTSLDEVVMHDVLWPSDATPGATWPVITGRFVRRDGTLWRNTALIVYPDLFPFDQKLAKNQKMATDANGRFRLTLSTPCPPGGRRVYRISTGPRNSRIVGEINASRRFPEGINDLGDILLDHGQLVVSGIIVDQAGKPISGANIRVSQRVRTKKRTFWPTYHTAGSFQSNKDGTFACYRIPGHDLPRESLRLAVSHPKSSQRESRPFILGEKGVRIEIIDGATIEGSVLLETELDSTDITILLRSKSNGGRLLPLKPDGSFSQTGIPPGLFSLVVSLKSGTLKARRSSMARVEGIRLIPGTTNRDPRIQGIRIATKFKKLQVRVVDESGRPIRSGIIEVLGSYGLDFAYIDSGGLASLFVSSLPIGLRVSSYGYGVVELTSASANQEVKLRRGLRIRIVTNAKTVGSNPEYRLGGSILYVRPDGKRGMFVYGRNFPYQKRYFDGEGRIDCYLPRPGIYEFRPSFFFNSKDNVGRGGIPRMTKHPRFTVMEDSKLQIFEVHIPEAAIQAEVKRVQLRDTQR